MFLIMLYYMSPVTPQIEWTIPFFVINTGSDKAKSQPLPYC